MSMKTLILTFAVLFICTGLSAKEKSKDKDKEAIIKVITESTKAYRNKDFNKIANTFVHDESLVKTTAAKAGYSVNYGWKEISENYQTFFKNYPDPATGKFEKINFKIKVYKECAWATHDEMLYDEAGNKNKQVITHFLEKHNGEWKIVYMANIRELTWDMEEEAAR